MLSVLDVHPIRHTVHISSKEYYDGDIDDNVSSDSVESFLHCDVHSKVKLKNVSDYLHMFDEMKTITVAIEKPMQKKQFKRIKHQHAKPLLSPTQISAHPIFSKTSDESQEITENIALSDDLQST